VNRYSNLCGALVSSRWLFPTNESRLTNRAFAAAALALLLVAVPAAAGEAEWKQLHDQAAGHLQQGSLAQAELFGRAALKEAESSLGPDHRATEQSLSTLSLALRLQGKQEEALPLVQHLVAIRTKRYGADDPSTAIALHNNAEILIALDRFAEAGKLQNRALAVFEKKLGPNHPNTAAALHNLGAILLKQEKYKEAEKYLRRALAAKEKALKPGHLSIAHTLDNLASALDGQGRQIEAQKYKLRAERIRQRAQSPAKSGA
jgi:tetratricopeptide (TPR) repeat protein